MGIKPEDIDRAIAGGNKVVQQLKRVCPKADEPTLTTKKRIRQSSKPLSNKLETEFGNYLLSWHPDDWIYEQAITVRLANGLRYTVDWIVCTRYPPFRTDCYEVKGRRAWDDAIAKLKMAASVYPMWHWFLVWKEGNSWESQPVRR